MWGLHSARAAGCATAGFSPPPPDVVLPRRSPPLVPPASLPPLAAGAHARQLSAVVTCTPELLTAGCIKCTAPANPKGLDPPNGKSLLR